VKEKHRLRVMLEQGAEEVIWILTLVTGGRRKLNNEELHDLYPSPNIGQ
jgi:hypothetical protein